MIFGQFTYSEYAIESLNIDIDFYILLCDSFPLFKFAETMRAFIRNMQNYTWISIWYENRHDLYTLRIC